MWSDNESEKDLLGFEHLSNAAVTLIRNDALLPATVGIFGDWGSGKSSLLQIVSRQLEADEGTIVLCFNGWLFEDYEDAKTALMGSILEELLDHQGVNGKAKDGIKALLKRVNKFKLAVGIGKIAVGIGTGLYPVAMGGGLDLFSAASLLSEKGKDLDAETFKGILREKNEREEEEAAQRRQIREFRKDFAKLLDEGGVQRLVVIIDDLDRCLPDTIIETLEAIKLFLFVKKTAFILGADERLVTYAVRTRFPELPGEQVEVGRDYLEKLVQFPIRIPPLGHNEMEVYIALLFAGLNAELPDKEREEATNQAVFLTANDGGSAKSPHEIVSALLKGEVAGELKEKLAIASRIAPVLAAGLKGNPRQCKRFLNTLLIRSGMAQYRGIELNQQVLAKLMLLEYFKPESFRKLAELQMAQNGKPKQLKQLEGKVEVVAATEEVKETKEVRVSSKPLKAKKAEGNEVREVGEPTLSDNELEVWAKQSWTNDWLQMEPLLADVDLRPYFFFSRDHLAGLQFGDVNRTSPIAREVLMTLLSESEAIRNSGVEKAVTLGEADAAGVFDGLSRRAFDTETYGKANIALMSLFAICEVRPELVPEIILFLKRLPGSKIEPVIVVKTRRLGAGESEGAVVELISEWSNSSNAILAAAAKMSLDRKTGD
jgi:hypothetical protein